MLCFASVTRWRAYLEDSNSKHRLPCLKKDLPFWLLLSDRFLSPLGRHSSEASQGFKGVPLGAFSKDSSLQMSLIFSHPLTLELCLLIIQAIKMFAFCVCADVPWQREGRVTCVKKTNKAIWMLNPFHVMPTSGHSLVLSECTHTNTCTCICVITVIYGNVSPITCN
jgi:hypothetical protein